ncbi:MAG: ABC transporter permease [Anaerolineae bacterium]|nr:ABC transporter permease [Anaerolineae bacterium]
MINTATLAQVSKQQMAALLRFLAILGLALLVFAIVLLVFGKNPIEAYIAIFASTIGSSYGWSEVLVKVIPLVLCATAVLLPARIGLVNVGGEGQLYMGALLASWGALALSDVLPGFMGLPTIIILGFVGGGLWAAIPAVLRAMGWLNETISTLLLNYVAILWVDYFVFGPLRDPSSANFPQSEPFPDAFRLPFLGSTRIHFGLIIATVAVAALYFVLNRTRWGYEMRAIGGNPNASRRHGMPISRYIIVTMFIAGGLAGLAGMGETMAIQGRLRPGFSPDYGYIGFLISWLALHNPLGVVVMSFLLAIIALGGDTLQITQSMPFSSVNVLMSIILFIVLAKFSFGDIFKRFTKKEATS